MVTELQDYTGITVHLPVCLCIQGLPGSYLERVFWPGMSSLLYVHVWILSISLTITVLHYLVFKIYLFHFWLCFVGISFFFFFNVLYVSIDAFL